ncbi:uncharacterized protein AMSG_12384 [Thecamonas trahens ATCC 50062]|uniref:PH domain-containing protein n=1 Tax=Thecamonas trahens ATCC 50062 TaxID=461836 RepID=A0A0L0DS43_THETB|nr:hypothetical protein AMSG_12384 [Thecamonas trahens ATCC 50062]KNC55144.1 hypothetical protein AMSG_12384 [Thecamonas trahens ATCC 50062]|eukprot:XP_013753250.1 hypothetical protein AMSG_12384 [Thecamonas trahens ATCC 50062]
MSDTFSHTFLHSQPRRLQAHVRAYVDVGGLESAARWQRTAGGSKGKGRGKGRGKLWKKKSKIKAKWVEVYAVVKGRVLKLFAAFEAPLPFLSLPLDDVSRVVPVADSINELHGLELRARALEVHFALSGEHADLLPIDSPLLLAFASPLVRDQWVEGIPAWRSVSVSRAKLAEWARISEALGPDADLGLVTPETAAGIRTIRDLHPELAPRLAVEYVVGDHEEPPAQMSMVGGAEADQVEEHTEFTESDSLPALGSVAVDAADVVEMKRLIVRMHDDLERSMHRTYALEAYTSHLAERLHASDNTNLPLGPDAASRLEGPYRPPTAVSQRRAMATTLESMAEAVRSRRDMQTTRMAAVLMEARLQARARQQAAPPRTSRAALKARLATTEAHLDGLRALRRALDAQRTALATAHARARH